MMRAALLRRPDTLVIHWGDLGRLHVVRSKTDRAATDVLLAIQPGESVVDPGASVFGLSASHISRRVKAAAKTVGLGDGFSARLLRVGMA